MNRPAVTAVLTVLLPTAAAMLCGSLESSLDTKVAIAINVSSFDVTDLVAVTDFEQAFVDAYNELNEFNYNQCDPFFQVLTEASLDTTQTKFPTHSHRSRSRRRTMALLTGDGTDGDIGDHPVLDLTSYSSPVSASVPSALQHRKLAPSWTAPSDWNVYFLHVRGRCTGCGSGGTLFHNDVSARPREGRRTNVRQRQQDTDNRELTPSSSNCACPNNVTDIRPPTVQEVIEYLQVINQAYLVEDDETAEIQPVDCDATETTFWNTITVRLELFLGDPDDPLLQDSIQQCILEGYNFAAFDLCDSQFRYLYDASVRNYTVYDATNNVYDFVVEVDGDCRGCDAYPDIFSEVPDDYYYFYHHHHHYHYGVDDYFYHYHYGVDDYFYSYYGADDDYYSYFYNNDDNGYSYYNYNDDHGTDRRRLLSTAFRKDVMADASERNDRTSFARKRRMFDDGTCYCTWWTAGEAWADRAQTRIEFLISVDQCFAYYYEDIYVH